MSVILCYHNIVPDWTPPEVCAARLAVRVSEFGRQLRFFHRHFAFGTLADVEARREGQILVVTFDDGYGAVIEHALPVLQSRRVPAYVFVNPAFVGGWNSRDKLMGLALYGSAAARRAASGFLDTPMQDGTLVRRARHFAALRTQMWRVMAARGESAVEDIEQLFARHADPLVLDGLRKSRLLSWEELARLREQGIQVGNHTRRHLELDRLPREVVRREIRGASQDLRDHLGTDIPVISYPRGKSNALVREQASAAGYRWGLLASPGTLANGRPTLSAPRVVVSPGGGMTNLLWKMSRLRQWSRGIVRARIEA